MPDTFTYTLNPGGSSATVSVTVTCVDDPPVAVDDAASINEDAPATAIDVLANDTDPTPAPQSVASVTQPANGTVVINGGGTSLTYQPNPNYCNNPPGTTPDTFTYTLAPGGSSTTVSVLVMCVNDPPVADNDAFDFVGNTELRVDPAVAGTTPHVLETTPSTFGVIDGDSDPVENDPIFVAAIVGCADVTAPFNCVIAGVGTVDMESNGRFTFVPVAGDTGASESFQYTLSDGQATVNATVTLTRFERVWYVKNDSVAGGLGRSADPFDTLAEAQTASLANDYIFVYFGTGAAGGQNQGIALKSGQHLIGEHAGLSLNVNLNGNGAPTNLVAAVAGNRPLINDANAAAPEGVAATDVVPAEIVGLSLGGANVNAIDWTTTAAFAGGGSFSIRDNVIRTAAAEGVDITLSGTGAVNLAFHDNTLTSTGTALDIQKPGTGTLTITAFANNVVNGNSAAAGLVVNNARFDAVPGGGIDLVSGGTTQIGAGGNGVGGAGLILGNVTGSLSFTDLDVFTDNGAALQAVGGAGGFTLAVAPSVSTLQATNGPAVDVTSTAITLPIQNIQSTNSASSGVSLATVTGTFSAGGGSTLTTNTGRAFQVDGSNATISYAGTITNNGMGISLTNNTGSTISFTGAMTMSTGANAAFTATGGGTVTATNTASTVATTSGTAVNVANTTIGAANLTFRSVSANGGASGIVLNNTGAVGGLRVVGTGGPGTGGTIQNISGDGVRLANTRNTLLSFMNINNVASAPGATCTFQNASDCNAAVDMVSATNVTLDDLVINGSGQIGISGHLVNGLTLTDSQVLNAGNGNDEFGLLFSNLSGTGLIEDVLIDNMEEGAIRLYNNTGNLSLTVNRTIMSDNDAVSGFGEDGFQIEIEGSAQSTILVDDSDFLRLQRDGVDAIVEGTSGANLNLTVRNSDFNDNAGLGGVIVASGNSATGNITVTGSRFEDTVSTAITMVQTADSNLQTTIRNNTISHPSPPAAQIGFGIRLSQEEDGDMTAVVEGNTISGTGFDGLRAFARLGDLPAADGDSGTLHITVMNNTIAAPLNVTFAADIQAQNTENQVCLNIRDTGAPGNNTFNGNVAAGIRARQLASSVFQVEGLALGGQSLATMQTFLDANNTNNPAALVSPAGSVYTGVAAGTCRTPAVTPLP